jgi:hypothetical protein
MLPCYLQDFLYPASENYKQSLDNPFINAIMTKTDADAIYLKEFSLAKASGKNVRKGKDFS